VIAVPVKPLERAKSRLSSLLSPLERAALTLAMLEDVLDGCLAQDRYGWEVWVVSKAEAVLEIAARRGAKPVLEVGGSLLEAVRQVEAEVRGKRSELAVMLADLPRMGKAELSAALATPGRVVAAPAGSDGGTNLLVRRPAMAIPARFGRGSFAKHRWAARRAGLGFETVDLPGLAFDLDGPEDLARLLANGAPNADGVGGRTLSACQDLHVAQRLRVRA